MRVHAEVAASAGRCGMTKKREFVSRWGNTITDDYQWCHVPGFVLRNYSKCVSAVEILDDKGSISVRRGQLVGVSMQDLMFVVHIMAFKYDSPDAKAKPGLQTIADYAGLNINNVRRIKRRLMDYGLLSVEKNEGFPDIYNFGGLHDQCVRLESGLSPIEGVEVYTPPKIERGHKFERGTPPKNESTPLSKIGGEELGNEKQERKSHAQKRERKNDPFYDAIAAVWKLTASGQIVSMRSMMRGEAKRGTWKDCNFDPPVTDAEEITAFGVYMEKRMREMNLTEPVFAAVTIQRWFYDFRAEEVKKALPPAPPPAPASVPASPFKKFNADFEAWQAEQEIEVAS